jgi:hypothetical protein
MNKLKKWFWLIEIQTLISIVWLLLIPKEPGNAFVLGYSIRRLALLTAMTLPLVFVLFIKPGLEKSEKRRSWLTDDQKKGKTAVFLVGSGFLLVASTWISVYMIRSLPMFSDQAAYVRLLPFLVLYLLLGIEVILSVPFILYPIKNESREESHPLRLAVFLIVFAVFITGLMVVGIIGLRFDPESKSVVSLGKLLLEGQIWYITGFLLLLIEASLAWRTIPRKVRPTIRLNIHLNEHWQKAFLIVFSILFTLLIGEFVLQVSYRIKNHKWLWENTAFEVNYIIPTKDKRQYTLKPDYYDIEHNMPIDKWGERITKQAESLESTHNVIVCLGDSVPFGAGIGNNDTYPFYLAKELTDKGFKYYVINAGVPSYNLNQSFERLILDVYNHVDVKDVKVITLQVSNDISLFMYYRENWTPELTWADIRFNFHPIPLANKLAIPYNISQLMSQPKGRSNTPLSDLIIEKISMLLQQKLTELRKTNPNAIVILLPSNPFYYQLANSDRNSDLKFWDQYSGANSTLVEDWDQNVRDFNSVLSDVSKNFKNVYFLDIREAMDKEERDDFFVDFIHLSGEGSKYQAKLIAELLIEKGLIQKIND